MYRQMILLVAMIAITLEAGCASKTASQPLELGHPIPTLELKTASENSPFVMSSLKGEVVILNFWSTSCGVCMKEIEELKEIHDSGKAKVIGIALDQAADRVRSVMEKRGVNYPVLMGDQTTFERFDGYSIPYTIVLDRSHIVLKRFFGPMSEQDLDDVLKSNSASKSASKAPRDLVSRVNQVH
ncbi:MAG: TlpA disulfide reductase family protein [Pirellula sp.]